MIRSIFCFFFLLFAAASCSDKTDVPKGILPPDKLTPVIWDMMRADEMVNAATRPDSVLGRFKKSVVLYDQIFRIHKIDKATVQRSLDYYEANPGKFRIILDSLQVRSDSATRRLNPRPS